MTVNVFTVYLEYRRHYPLQLVLAQVANLAGFASSIVNASVSASIFPSHTCIVITFSDMNK